MRMVFYGRFVDFWPVSYDYDDDLIGGHIYARQSERASLRTAGYEYYVIEDGDYKTIYDANLLEKMFARFLFMFKVKKRKVLGVRSEKVVKVNPYSDPCPQLGVRLDESGKKVVDTDYYHDALERSSKEEVEKKKSEAEEFVASLTDDQIASLTTSSTEPENPKKLIK